MEWRKLEDFCRNKIYLNLLLVLVPRWQSIFFSSPFILCYWQQILPPLPCIPCDPPFPPPPLPQVINCDYSLRPCKLPFGEKEANTELTKNDLKKYENQSALNHHSSFPVLHSYSFLATIWISLQESACHTFMLPWELLFCHNASVFCTMFIDFSWKVISDFFK